MEGIILEERKSGGVLLKSHPQACPVASYTAQCSTMSRPLLSLAAAFLTAITVTLLTGCASAPIVYQSGETIKGDATWYGREQHGRRTANGERFDMYKLTAAHRHLPFGAMVRVTNLRNGLSVVVRINDRGPFGDSDRIIDVSSAAADILQMKRAGVIPVEVEVLSLPPPRKKKHQTGG